MARQQAGYINVTVRAAAAQATAETNAAAEAALLYARLDGGNILTGDQTIDGVLTVNGNLRVDLGSSSTFGGAVVLQCATDAYTDFQFNDFNGVPRAAIFGGTTTDHAAYWDADKIILEDFAEANQFATFEVTDVRLKTHNVDRLVVTDAGVDVTGTLTVNGSPISVAGELLHGAVAPDASIGADGDFYIDDVAWEIYGPKAGGAWPAGVSIVGPAGPAGAAGAAGAAGPAGAPGAMTLISEVVTAGSQASVTFSAIAATYRDLVVVLRGRSSAAVANVNVQLQFNGDTAANYEWSQMEFQGATNFSGGTTGVTQIVPGVFPGASAPAGAPGLMEAVIYDYRGTTFHKGTTSRNGAQVGTGNTVFEIVGYGRWKNTAAINAVKAFLSSGNFVDGTVVSLYGRM